MTGYFHFDKLSAYFDKCAVPGQPSEAGWYVIEISSYALGIGFLDPMADRINYVRLSTRYVFGDPILNVESGVLDCAYMIEVRRYAPLRFDLNKEP